MTITGVNHVTLSVRDLERSLRFYAGILGCCARARWSRGAYLEAGTVWLCLELDARAGAEATDDSHVAFTVSADAFPDVAAAVRASGARIWKENRSEGDSLYFEDPDGHRLELHVGDLETRLRACRARPYEGMTFFDPAPGRGGPR